MRGQRQAAVGVGRRREIVGEQRSLPLRDGVSDQPVEQGGEARASVALVLVADQMQRPAAMPCSSHQRTSASSRPWVTQTSRGAGLVDGRGQFVPVGSGRR